jgi:carbon-monoxide dehydrogenase large subunit
VTVADRPKHVGARVQRFEDIRLLSGFARYIDDIRLPRALHLRFVRADIAHADIVSIDRSALDGLGYPTWVFTGKDTAGLSMKAHQDTPEMQYSEQPLLAESRVRFVGEPVAVVLAVGAYKAAGAGELHGGE